MRGRIPWLVLCLVIAPLRASPADVILAWNALMLDAIRADNSGPALSTRNLAILHTAIYDALNSIRERGQPYKFRINTPDGASPEAAAASAAHTIMLALYPGFTARTAQLYQKSLDDLGLTASITNGLSVGVQIARLALSSRDGDGSNTQITYIPRNEPGQWRRTPPFFRPPVTPHWGRVKLFGLPELERFVPGPPPALDSAAYAVALNEVKMLGAGTGSTRTAEQSQIAVFWSDFSYTAMPSGHWHEIAATIARERGNSLEEKARLFALLSIAQADAAIVCWEAKYRYNYWRPVTAINRADEDQNAATEADTGWNSFLASPPFPSYVSGHSTFSKASSEILTLIYDSDAITFTATSDSLPGVTRTYHSLAACADEIGRSRIYGGIHYEFDNSEGKACGKKIAEYTFANWLLPVDKLPKLLLEDVRDDRIMIRMHAAVDRSYVLETSRNLIDWDTVLTNQGIPGGTAFNAMSHGNDSHCFYRLAGR